MAACNEVHGTITALQAENERLRKALEFYAQGSAGDVEDLVPVIINGEEVGTDMSGKIANEALKEIAEDKIRETLASIREKLK